VTDVIKDTLFVVGVQLKKKLIGYRKLNLRSQSKRLLSGQSAVEPTDSPVDISRHIGLYTRQPLGSRQPD